MKLTLNKDINLHSIMVSHDIVTRAIDLIAGREGALLTEKIMYLIIGMVDVLIEEDLVAECNEDGRTLNEIVRDDIEPFFNKLQEDNEYCELFNQCKSIYLDYCDRVWQNQHSITGVIDTLLTAISLMDGNDKKEVLEKTGEVAAKLYEERTEKMEQASEKVNNKLEELVKQYQKIDQEKTNKLKEITDNKND